MSIKSIQYPVIQKTDTKDKNELIIFIDKSNQVTTVPNGWQRKLINNRICYISPSQQIINNLDELSVYLKSKGTCKCGLSCPFFLQEYFSFDPQVETVENTIDQTKISCKHRKLTNNNNNLINNSIDIHQQHHQTNHQPNNQQQQQIIEINGNLLSNIISNYESSNRVLYSINSNTPSKVSNSVGQINKLIQIQNPIQNNKTIKNNSINKVSNQQIQFNQQTQQNQINIQQIINLKQNEHSDTNSNQIVGYIPILRGDNLANLNLLNQPIIVNSPFKTTTIKNETSDSQKFLNTVIQSPSTEIYTIHPN